MENRRNIEKGGWSIKNRRLEGYDKNSRFSGNIKGNFNNRNGNDDERNKGREWKRKKKGRNDRKGKNWKWGVRKMIIRDLLEYKKMRIIWWVMIGVMMIGFEEMDGLEIGVGKIMNLVERKDVESRVVINKIGKVWEGNKVWLIIGGGEILEEWKKIYEV